MNDSNYKKHLHATYDYYLSLFEELQLIDIEVIFILYDYEQSYEGSASKSAGDHFNNFIALIKENLELEESICVAIIKRLIGKGLLQLPETIDNKTSHITQLTLAIMKFINNPEN